RAGRVAGSDIGRGRCIVSSRDSTARTVVGSGKRGQNGEVASLMRQEKLTLPLQQCRAAVGLVQFLEKPRRSSGDAHFWFFRFLGRRFWHVREQHGRDRRKNRTNPQSLPPLL